MFIIGWIVSAEGLGVVEIINDTLCWLANEKLRILNITNG